MKKVFAILMMALVGFTSACSKKGGSSVATAPDTYHLDGGRCFNQNNTQVDYGLCDDDDNGDYYWNDNNQCCNSDGGVVGNSYCDDIDDDGYDNDYGQVCSGLYWYIDYYTGALYKVRCDGRTRNGNCSGYELIKGNTGKTVYCR